MEFVEVMRQWKRRFEAEKILTDSETSGLDALWLAMDNPEEIESMVMSWAAEHPEPIYPTWGNWLAEIGLINWQNNGEGEYSVMFPTFKMCKPIPAEIAQKLGIEPVPIFHGDCGVTNETDARKKLGIEPKEVR